MERRLGVASAAKGIRGMVVEALFCLPHLFVGHCLFTLRFPDCWSR